MLLPVKQRGELSQQGSQNLYTTELLPMGQSNVSIPPLSSRAPDASTHVPYTGSLLPQTAGRLARTRVCSIACRCRVPPSHCRQQALQGQQPFLLGTPPGCSKAWAGTSTVQDLCWHIPTTFPSHSGSTGVDAGVGSRQSCAGKDWGGFPK